MRQDTRERGVWVGSTERNPGLGFHGLLILEERVPPDAEVEHS